MPAVITSAGEIEFAEPVFQEILRILPDVASRKIYTLDPRDIGGVTIDVGGPGVGYSVIRLQWQGNTATLNDTQVTQMLERHAAAVSAVAAPRPQPAPVEPAPAPAVTMPAAAPVAAAASSASPGAEWFLDIDGKSRGPYSMDEIVGFVQEGRARPDQLVWRKGEDAWSPLKTHPLFAERLAAPVAVETVADLATDTARSQVADLVELIRSHIRSVNKYVTAEERAAFEKWLGQYIAQGAGPTVEAAIGEILTSHDTPLFMKSRLIQSLTQLALPNLAALIQTAVKDKALRQYLQDKKLREIVQAMLRDGQ